MRTHILSLCALVLWPAILPASDFDWLVREFSRESGAQQVHVPFLGFARFVVQIGHPAGTTDMRLAIFERGDLDSMRFRAITDTTVGGSWKPMIRIRSSKGEATNIYERTEGKHLNLLITALDNDDATFVQVRVKPEALLRFVDEHEHH
ncbi:MAG TPA: hypothetical protein VKX25_03230 [Bryobacteraceae bacterium]|jgi:hypothetical protein|nr:hypothetical protein [Bryobacteraceae bacterium]